MPDIEFRLTALERENERLHGVLARQTRAVRVLGTLLAVLLLGGILMGAAKLASEGDKEFDTVTAKKLVIVKDGKERIRLETGSDPEAKVVMLGSDGVEKGGFWLHPDSMWFYASQGDKAHAEIHCYKDSVGFTLTSGGDNAPLGLYSSGDTHRIILRNKEAGAGTAASLINSNGLPAILLSDTKGTKVQISLDKDGKPILRFQETPITASRLPAEDKLPQIEIVDGKLQRKK